MTDAELKRNKTSMVKSLDDQDADASEATMQHLILTFRSHLSYKAVKNSIEDAKY